MRVKALGVLLSALALLGAPLLAHAQPAAKVYRVGFLGNAPVPALIAVFVDGLRERGRIESQNLVIDYRWIRGENQRVPELAAELVALKPDVFVVTSAPATAAAMQATKTIPIVMAGTGDPVGYGFIQSLARPGGNVTGVTTLGSEFVGKHLELLREVAPRMARVAMFVNPTNQATPLVLKNAAAATDATGVKVEPVEVRTANDFDAAFAAIVRQRSEGIIVGPEGLLFAQRQRIAEFAARQRLPVIYGLSVFMDAGGLMSYGADVADLLRRAAVYVDLVLKGADPAALPVEQPTDSSS